MRDLDFEFGEPFLSFVTVGELREFLKNYPDDTTLMVEDIPGLFIADEERQYINLCRIEYGDDDYPVSDIESPAMVCADYMDF